MAQTFSDYIKETLPFLGGTIDLEFRALDSSEASEFRRVVQDRFSGNEQREGESAEDFTKRSVEYMRGWHRFQRETFERTYTTKKGEVRGYYIRVASPLIHEEDESRNITDGASLWKRSSAEFRMAVMLKLTGYAALGDEEGNASGSPSTSTSAAGLPTTASPAITTDASPTSPSCSTATAPISLVVSSTPAA